MKRKLFSAYTNNIKHVLSNPQIFNQRFEKSLNEDLSSFTKSRQSIALSADLPDLEANIGINTLKGLLGIDKNVTISNGDHPDFKHLRYTGGTEKHYIVSCFIDVRNSTNLFKSTKNYNHNQIAGVIQTIQAAAIHTCSLFNAHIQRLQYDGVFVYFGGKGYSKEEAIEDAIKATSFFSYFMKYELPEVFNEIGIEEINTRVGIDFGDTEDVSWYVFGVNECSELTTLSLHTSLAPKMQSNAPKNGVVIGENMLTFNGSLNQFSSIIKDSDGKENRYIFYQPNYTQYKFDWEQYLASNYRFVHKEGGLIFIDYEHEEPIKGHTYSNVNYLSAGADEGLYELAKQSRPWYNG